MSNMEAAMRPTQQAMAPGQQGCGYGDGSAYRRWASSAALAFGSTGGEARTSGYLQDNVEKYLKTYDAQRDMPIPVGENGLKAGEFLPPQINKQPAPSVEGIVPSPAISWITPSTSHNFDYPDINKLWDGFNTTSTSKPLDINKLGTRLPKVQDGLYG